MLYYDIAPEIEAFSTEASDALTFDVTVPEYQSHGTASRIIESAADASLTMNTDALITRIPGLRIGVRTADCVPILIHAPQSAAIAAIHSGWKGTVANITAKVCQQIKQQFPTGLTSAKAIIGPCIHLEAFEVGDEVYQAFADAGYGQYCHRFPRLDGAPGEKWHADLPGICASQLRLCGITDILVSPLCTYATFPRFHSARRLGPAFANQRIITAIRLLPRL